MEITPPVEEKSVVEEGGIVFPREKGMVEVKRIL